MFLLHVGPNLHAVGSDHLAVTQQLRRGRFDPAFVGDVCEDVAFDPHEIEAGGVRDREGGEVRPGEDLDATGEAARLFHGATDDGHRGDDLRPYAAAQVGHVVHVLDHHSVNAAVAVERGLARRLRREFADARLARGRAGQRADMNHADDRLRFVEQGSEHGHGYSPNRNSHHGDSSTDFSLCGRGHGDRQRHGD